MPKAIGEMGRLTHMRTRTVDVYLYSGHEVAVMEPIWLALRQRGVDAQFVLEPPGTHRAMGAVPNPDTWRVQHSGGPIEPLMDEATYVAVSELLASRDLPFISASRTHADAVLTTQGHGWLLHYSGLKIRVEYGASVFADVYGHGEINAAMDAVLTHGLYSTRSISSQLPSDRIIPVGYPKWAPAMRAGLNRQQARDSLDLDSTKPLIVWTPTWAHNATIDSYAAAVVALSDQYEVVLKPHHNTLRFEGERINELAKHITVLDNAHTLVPLVTAADLVVADARSGCLAEAVFADRCALGLLDRATPRSLGVLEGFDDAVAFCASPDELVGAVTDALGTDRSAGRAMWRSWLYADHHNQDDHVAAEAIINLIDAPGRRPTTGLNLATLDELLDATIPLAAQGGEATAKALHTLRRTWPIWPGHPRLLKLVDALRTSLAPEELAGVAAMVRAVPHSPCPAMATANDPGAAPTLRLAAAAIASDRFLEPGADELFFSLIATVPEPQFAEALASLALVPDALPAFVQGAATTPSRCKALAQALNNLGASEQAAAVAHHGERLVLQ